MRELCELQTTRAGLVGSLTEWKNRSTSGLAGATARAVAGATIDHFTAQLKGVDQPIAETIDQDLDLRGKRDLLLSISGVGDPLAGILLAEMSGPEVLRREACLHKGTK